ncbi:MAG: ATP-dependent 6-phosphofructokinase [Candidatus Shikimatogenerans bostrichidophilus]|nr:MAG: ATP-dependent 6-phosphofructokinase [Candidatus Shikimatogenerans bostrichidophilus]
MIKIKNIGIITSGGDSPGMNAAIKSIVNYSNINNINCLGFKNGYNGLINGDIIKLSNNNVNNIIGLGGTILGSGRSEEFKNKIGRKKAYNNIINNNLDGLIIIGGDGSFTGSIIFNEEYNFPIIGIPGTIDNDIYGTDLTIGYDTALNTIIYAVEKIQDTANSNNRIFIIEVMGKNLGFLALNSGIAIGSLDIIINKEKNNKYNIKRIINLLKKGEKNSNIIIVAENKNIGYAAKKIYNQIKEKIDKYEIRYSILGHIQRGGSPTCLDRILAIRLGLESIKQLINFKKNIVIGIKNNKITYIPFNKSIQKYNKKFDDNIKQIYKDMYLKEI